MPTYWPKASTIIVNYNGAKFINMCISSVLKTKYSNLEVILIDNASTDRSLEVIKEYFGRIRLIGSKKNLGYAGGCNLGAKYADPKSKYLAFLNVDVAVDPNWLANIIEVLENDENIACAQSILVSMKDKKTITHAGAFISQNAKPIISKGFAAQELTNNFKVSEVFFASGAALVIKKNLFKRVNGFDEGYFMYFEDEDLCWRLRLLGYKVVSIPASIVYHHEGAIASAHTWTRYLAERNHLITFLKNFELWTVIKYLPFLLFGKLYELLTLLLRKNLVNVILLVKAFLYVVKNAKMIAIARRGVQETRLVTDRELKKFIVTSLR